MQAVTHEITSAYRSWYRQVLAGFTATPPKCYAVNGISTSLPLGRVWRIRSTFAAVERMLKLFYTRDYDDKSTEITSRRISNVAVYALADKHDLEDLKRLAEVNLDENSQ